MRVLLVEDDQMLGTALLQALHDASYAVDWVVDGPLASAALDTEEYELVLLDLGLPRRDGIEVLRRLRGRGDATPVLIITARDSVDQRIEGLDVGADDYLGKPFAVGELLARMRALARRRAGASSSTLTNGVLALELATKLAVVGGASHTLSHREFALLQALMLRPGAVLSRAQLEQSIYGWGEEVESNAVSVYVHQLRKKLGPELIRTMRGVGYYLGRREVADGAGGAPT